MNHEEVDNAIPSISTYESIKQKYTPRHVLALGELGVHHCLVIKHFYGLNTLVNTDNFGFTDLALPYLYLPIPSPRPTHPTSYSTALLTRILPHHHTIYSLVCP